MSHVRPGLIRYRYSDHVGPGGSTSPLSTIDTHKSKLRMRLVLEVSAKLMVLENSRWAHSKVGVCLVLEACLVHRQDTRQVTDIMGCLWKCASKYNDNTRPASNHSIPWVILGAQFFDACHTQTKSSQLVPLRSELGVSRYGWVMIRYVSRYGGQDTIRITIHYDMLKQSQHACSFLPFNLAQSLAFAFPSLFLQGTLQVTAKI